LNKNMKASRRSLARKLVETLPYGVDGLFNPWRDHCPHDAEGNGPEAKLQRLALHLDCDPEFILAGEAPGYQGCRYSGIAFTSERLLGEGVIPRIPALAGRLSTRRLPFSEPSATIVWKTLYRLGIAERTILWNAMQLHPHRADDLWSNRTPSPEEIRLGAPAMRLLIEAFPRAKIVAVGKKAEGLLAEMGVQVTGAVRHPANGGATEFANGLNALIG
jgi:uracil-DNA glycosylase